MYILYTYRSHTIRIPSTYHFVDAHVFSAPQRQNNNNAPAGQRAHAVRRDTVTTTDAVTTTAPADSTSSTAPQKETTSIRRRSLRVSQRSQKGKIADRTENAGDPSFWVKKQSGCKWYFREFFLSGKWNKAAKYHKAYYPQQLRPLSLSLSLTASDVYYVIIV